MTGRRSFWKIHLNRARKTGDWYHIPRYYTRLTASQICSDIRGHRRITGFHDGEHWQANWEQEDVDDDIRCTIKIRLLEPTYDQSAET